MQTAILKGFNRKQSSAQPRPEFTSSVAKGATLRLVCHRSNTSQAGFELTLRCRSLAKLAWSLCVCLFPVLYSGAMAKDTAQTVLTFAVNPSSATQQEVYHLLGRHFETSHPGVRVDVISRSSLDHVKRLEGFVAQGQPPADVILVYAGAQLRSLATANRLADLSDFWASHKLQEQFSTNTRHSIQVDRREYAVPLNYYQWGIYFKKTIFSRLNLSPPKNWTELKALVETLKQHQITPFSLSGQTPWTLAAWFDYFNLRLNGLDFHTQLLAGQQSYLDSRVTKVFVHWRELIELGAFDLSHLQNDWEASLPYFYRDFVAMSLMGNFFIAHVPPPIKDSIGFFPFPALLEDMPRFENVPLDVAVLSKEADQPELAKQFLLFLSLPDTQSLLNNYVGKVSANLFAQHQSSDFIEIGKKHIESAQGFAAFFDRDTVPAFSKQAMPLFYDFVEHPDQMARIQRQLESARLIRHQAE